jgi:chorismate mutase/prephenate dehydratase
MASTAPGRENEIAVLREQIDRLDGELLALMNRRAGVALAIGELKRADGSPAFRPDREGRRSSTASRRRTPGPAADESVAPIWREIMSACRALETPTRVAYLGPAGTFSELAALGYFGSSIVKVLCANADEVFHATSAGAADFGVVPVENSSEGVVTRSLDLFLTTPLVIVGETSLYVRHNLLRRTELDRRDRRGLRASAGARAMPRLAQPSPAERRAPAGREQRRGRAPGEPRPAPGRHRQRARGERVRPARRRAGDPGRRAQPHPLRRRRAPGCASAAEGDRPRLHQPRRLGAEPAGRGARHARAAEGARRLDDAVRVAPRALGAVGVLLLRRPAGPSRPAEVAAALAELREVSSFFKLLGTYPVDSH